MPRDLDGLADMVVLTVKAALLPLMERLAATEARLGLLLDSEKSLRTLRDQVVILETKAAMPVPPDPILHEPTPAVSVDAFTEVRDRVLVLETKAALPPDTAISDVVLRVRALETVPSPPPLDTERLLSGVTQRIATLEGRPEPQPTVSSETFAEVRDRVLVLGTRVDALEKAPPLDTERLLSGVTQRVATLEGRPEPPTVSPDALAAVRDRVLVIETHGKSHSEPVTVPVVHDDGLTKALAAVSERLAVVETRAPIPGPPGHDGHDGKDGADGLGWDDLTVVQEDERTATIRCQRGLQVKDVGTLTFPVEIYRGVYVTGKTYERGDGVTWGGSEWHCNETTVTKPGESKAWTLKVKRGQDGKDGRDAETLPVVSVGRR